MFFFDAFIDSVFRVNSLFFLSLSLKNGILLKKTKQKRSKITTINKEVIFVSSVSTVRIQRSNGEAAFNNLKVLKLHKTMDRRRDYLKLHFLRVWLHGKEQGFFYFKHF